MGLAHKEALYQVLSTFTYYFYLYQTGATTTGDEGDACLNISTSGMFHATSFKQIWQYYSYIPLSVDMSKSQICWRFSYFPNKLLKCSFFLGHPLIGYAFVSSAGNLFSLNEYSRQAV